MDRGVLSRASLPKLPNLVDGHALSFAAAEQGNSKAAKRAREAAYTEQESSETFDNLLLNASDKQLAIQPTKYSSFYNDYLEKKEPSQDNSKSWNIVGINDHVALQDAFNKVRKPGATADDLGQPGDFDGVWGLQCVDLSNWFLDEYTTLGSVSGSGKDIVQNLANKYNLEVTTTPCAPAVFSVEKGTYGPGIRPGSVSDSVAGHTGIVLAVKDLGNDMYEITYIDTYKGYNDNGYNSNVRTRTFKKGDNVTYVSLEGHLK